MLLLWVKLIHVLFVISFMACAFYLPRIFIHYAIALSVGEETRRLSIMANKLYKFGISIYVIAISSGLYLGLLLNQFTSLWLILKLGLVIALGGYYLYLGLFLNKITLAQEIGKILFWRIYNELVLIILFFILYLVIFKPQ